MTSSSSGDLESAPRPTWRPPRWASPVSLVICVLGIAVASYLTYAHYTDARNLACSDSGTLNCAKVTTSAQSRFLGMPVAVLGLAFFVGMTVLCLPQLWRRQERLVRWVRLAGVVVGVGMILYLVAAELFIIEAICLYCTFVHGLTFLLFVTVVAATVSGVQRPADDYDYYDDDDEDDVEYDDADDQAQANV
jgi:uncharacterized membrane protein